MPAAVKCPWCEQGGVALVQGQLEAHQGRDFTGLCPMGGRRLEYAQEHAEIARRERGETAQG